jgi:hypothetical protein
MLLPQAKRRGELNAVLVSIFVTPLGKGGLFFPGQDTHPKAEAWYQTYKLTKKGKEYFPKQRYDQLGQNPKQAGLAQAEGNELPSLLP